MLVETAEALEELAARVASEPRLALDTEANSLHAFRERVCVVQLSAPGIDAIVDPLRVPELAPLRALVARRGVEIVMHGGDYDVSVLRREHGFAFGRVFDTMIAATLLAEPRVGLAALVEQDAGVLLSKRYQKADWARRPFTPEQVEYLRGDTSHLLRLRQHLGERLEAADLVEEADIEFRRLAAGREDRTADPAEAWRRVKGSDRLEAEGRAVLASVFRWRDERARTHDVPRFRVLLDETLLALAKHPPGDLAALRALPGTATVQRVGETDALFGAVAAGLTAAARGEAPPPPFRPRATPEEAQSQREANAREERLRDWRRVEAARRRVPPVVVLPNPALEAVSRVPPTDAAALSALPDVGPKRAALYADAILRLLTP